MSYDGNLVVGAGATITGASSTAAGVVAGSAARAGEFKINMTTEQEREERTSSFERRSKPWFVSNEEAI